MAEGLGGELGAAVVDSRLLRAESRRPWERQQRQNPGRRQAWFGRAARRHLCEALLLLQRWSPERGRAWLGTSFAFSTSA